MSNGMNFYLVFDVIGDGQAKLSDIVQQFSEVGQAGRMAGQAIQSAHGPIIAMIHGLRQMQDAGNLIRGFGQSAINVMEQFGRSVYENTAMFETLHERVNFAYQDFNEGPNRNPWEEMLQYSRQSVWELSDIAGVIGSMRTAIRGIDPTNENTQWVNRVGEMSNALQIMGDTAVGTGRSLSMVGYEVQQMMGGVFRGAHMVLRLTHEETEAIKHVVNSAVDAQTKFSKIMEVLSAHYGGATQALGGTLNYMVMQIPDLVQQIESAIGSGMIEPLGIALTEFVKFLNDTLSDTSFLDTVKSMFRDVGEAIQYAAHHLILFATEVRAFVSSHPYLVKFLVLVTAIGAALAIIVGTVTAVASAMAVFSAAVYLAGSVLAVSFGSALAVVGLFGAALAGLIGTVALVRYGFHENLGGIVDFFEKFSLIVKGVSQAISNWNGDVTMISLELAHQMENAGIYDQFVNIVMWMGRAKEYTLGVWDAIRDGFHSVDWSVLTRAFEEIKAAFMSFGIQLGVMENAGNTAFDSMRGRGYSFGQMLNEIIVPGIEASLYLVLGLAKAFRVAADTVISIRDGVLWLIENWQTAKYEVGLFGVALAAAVLIPMAGVLLSVGKFILILGAVVTAVYAIHRAFVAVSDSVSLVSAAVVRIWDAFLGVVTRITSIWDAMVSRMVSGVEGVAGSIASIFRGSWFDGSSVLPSAPSGVPGNVQTYRESRSDDEPRTVVALPRETPEAIPIRLVTQESSRRGGQAPEAPAPTTETTPSATAPSNGPVAYGRAPLRAVINLDGRTLAVAMTEAEEEDNLARGYFNTQNRSMT